MQMQHITIAIIYQHYQYLMYTCSILIYPCDLGCPPGGTIVVLCQEQTHINNNLHQSSSSLHCTMIVILISIHVNGFAEVSLFSWQIIANFPLY